MNACYHCSKHALAGRLQQSGVFPGKGYDPSRFVNLVADKGHGVILGDAVARIEIPSIFVVSCLIDTLFSVVATVG